jgi:hypothetical protein
MNNNFSRIKNLLDIKAERKNYIYCLRQPKETDGYPKTTD